MLRRGTLYHALPRCNHSPHRVRKRHAHSPSEVQIQAFFSSKYTSFTRTDHSMASRISFEWTLTRRHGSFSLCVLDIEPLLRHPHRGALHLVHANIRIPESQQETRNSANNTANVAFRAVECCERASRTFMIHDRRQSPRKRLLRRAQHSKHSAASEY